MKLVTIVYHAYLFRNKDHNNEHTRKNITAQIKHEAQLLLTAAIADRTALKILGWRVWWLGVGVRGWKL